MKNYHCLVSIGLYACLCGAAEHSVPWYKLINRPGANYYDIARAHEAHVAREKAEEDEEARDLTRLLQKDPKFYEVGEEFQFERWANFVKPRVAPSGDLALLDIGRREILRLAPVNGKPLPAMRGLWEALGPFANGTIGAGRLDWIDFHPADSSAFMVGSAGGGLWFTADAGKTWSTPTDKLANLGAAWGAYHPTNPDIIYLATGDGANDAEIFSIGLLKTMDGGKTWNTTGLVYDVSAYSQITKVVVDPRNPEKIFAATKSGLEISTDGGATFKAASGITEKVWDVEIHPTNSSIVYASGTAFYLSTNGGAAFVRNPSVTASYRMQLAVSAAMPEYVYVLRGAEGATEGVSRSVDAGTSFAQTGTGKLIGCPQTWFDYAFDANPLNAEELSAGCLQIYRSADGGANWALNGAGYHVDIHSTTYRKDGALFATTDGGVWRRTGSTWTNLNNNLNVGQSYRVGVHPSDYDQVCTGRQDNGTDIKAGATSGFQNALGDDGMECFWNAAGTRFYGEQYYGGFRSCNYANGKISTCFIGALTTEMGTWDTPWSRDPSDPVRLLGACRDNMFRGIDTAFYPAWTQMGTVGGTDHFEAGHSTLQLRRLDGKVLRQEKVPRFGLQSVRFDMAGQGKGVFLLVLESGGQRVSRRVLVH